MLAVAVLVLLALAIARATWAVTELRYQAPQPRRYQAPTRPAVVLVHGICGFDSIGVGPLRVDYFRRVRARLEQEGFEVHTASLPPLRGVPARAEVLRGLLDKISQDRVAIVAHSMGGLDARWAIAAGAASRVHTLITIGTPHAGTPIADLLARGPIERARALASKLGLGTDAIEWLTTWRAAALERECPIPPEIREACVIAATADRRLVHPLLRISHGYLARLGHASDGLVPAASQQRGEVIAELELDHWAQVGWSRRHDAGSLVLGALHHGDPSRLLAA